MIYFDEAGNTGDNLLDAFQPAFTLASHDFTLDETNELLAPLYSLVKSNELHFKSLSRRPRYQAELIKLLNNEALNKDKVFRYITHKEYSVVGHIVDRLIEQVLNVGGIDIYQEGQNVTMTNMIYILYQTSWKKDFKHICFLFVDWVRTKTTKSCEAFYAAVFRIFSKIKNEKTIGEEFIGFIMMSYDYRKEIQDGFDKTYTLDLTLSTFRVSGNFWAQKHVNPDIVMDASKPIAHFSHIIDMLKTADERIVGYGKRKYQFKLQIGEVKLEDSIKFPQLQLSDILASAFNFCAKEISFGNELNGFAKDIFESSSFQNSSGDTMWPSTDVTPESIGMKGAIIGKNPLDHFADEIIKQDIKID